MNLKMKDVMTANCQIPNAEMLTSNHCAALARELNKLLADALAAQRDEWLAREAELQKQVERLRVDAADVNWMVEQRDALQQRLAEAEKLLTAIEPWLSRISEKADQDPEPLPKLRAFLASPGCADEEKS